MTGPGLAPLTALGAALLLAGCGGAVVPAGQGEDDPQISAALSDPLMVDPDLAGQNRGNAAIGGGGPANGEVPPDGVDSESANAARDEAAVLLGGTLRHAPEAAGDAPPAVARAAETVTAMEFAALSPAGGVKCAGKLQYGMIWAARMPGALPVYPRAHVRQAAGVGADGCNLKVARFTSAVKPDELLDFYYTAATRAGFAAQRTRLDGGEALGGANGAARYALVVRARDNGLSEALLLVNGL